MAGYGRTGKQCAEQRPRWPSTACCPRVCRTNRVVACSQSGSGGPNTRGGRGSSPSRQTSRMSTDARRPRGISASLHSFRLGLLPRRHVLNFSSLVASQGIRMVTGLLFWLVTVHIAPSHEVGLAAAAFAALLICMLISALGFGPAIIRLQPQ